MIKVRFNDVGDFLAELEKEIERVDRGIVRVTRMTSKMYSMTSLAVVATVIVGADLIELRCAAGMLYGHNHPDDARVQTNAGAAMRQIEKFCELHGLQIRAGIFEPAEAA